MKKPLKKTAASMISLFLFSILLYSCASTSVQALHPSELKSMLGNAGVVVIDARRDKEWNMSDVKIKGAVRENPDDVPSWAGKYRKDKLIVLYCA
jgi:rhodanese-related sulfurtransferase